MIIYDNNGKLLLDIPVDDSSCRYRAIGQAKKVELHYSLPGHMELPMGSFIEYQGERYTLWSPSDIEKKGTRNFSYKVTFGGEEEILKKYKYKQLSDKPYKLKFPLTAKPELFIKLLVDNLNLYDTGWAVGDVIESAERLMSFNHENCWSVLGRLAQEFNTEFEIKKKTINLHKVQDLEKPPVKLSYGKGNGFVPGVGRTNQGDNLPVERLFVQGGEKNINHSTYGSKTLLLPKSETLNYEGRIYETDKDGMYITLKDKDLSARNEDSYDASHIYPTRVGTVTEVEMVPGKDSEGNPVAFYNIVDNNIPEALNYRDCRLDGNKATIIFQSGKLAGREFDIVQTDKELTGYDHATKTFKLVSLQEDGQTLPNETFCPLAGNEYAVFNISLPKTYVCDNDTKTGASWDMFREATRYLREHEERQFTFKGELDGIWAKKNWLAIGGLLVPGGYVDFSDTQFQPDGILIRITGVRDYINRPHSPELELSNAPVSGFLSDSLGKLEAEEVKNDKKNKDSNNFTKRSFQDAKETMGMLTDALLTNFTGSINPIGIATMQMLVGDESLQFRFVNSKTNPSVVDHNVTYDDVTKILWSPAGILQHMTIDIKDISSRHEYRFWDMGSYPSPPLESDKRYYLYARCSKNSQSGTFITVDKAIALEQEVGYYHFLVGVLNSEYNGERSYVSLYGFTEILPGRITTDKIVSSDGETYFNLADNHIHGNIEITSGNTFSRIKLMDESIGLKVTKADVESELGILDSKYESRFNVQGDLINAVTEKFDDKGNLLEGSGWLTKTDATTIYATNESVKNSISVSIKGIDLNGFATFTNLKKTADGAMQSATYIDGGKIKTSYIDTDSIFAKQASIAGFSIAYRRIVGWKEDEILGSSTFFIDSNTCEVGVDSRFTTYRLSANYPYKTVFDEGNTSLFIRKSLLTRRDGTSAAIKVSAVDADYAHLVDLECESASRWMTFLHCRHGDRSIALGTKQFSNDSAGTTRTTLRLSLMPSYTQVNTESTDGNRYNVKWDSKTGLLFIE